MSNSTQASPKTHPQASGAGDWLFQRSVLYWVFASDIGQQLPFLYQIFRTYCTLYFQFTQQEALQGGWSLFRLLSYLYTRLQPQAYLQFSLPDYHVFLEPRDPRLFQVVNELTQPDSDVRVLAHLLAPGDSFIDVGANHGSFAIAASRQVGPKGTVIAIEPQPRLAQAVQKSLNHNTSCNVQVHPVAVSDHEGIVDLLIPLSTSGSAGLFTQHSGTDLHRTIAVPLKRLDDLIDWQHLPGQVVLKLDVEGSEMAFLAGAAALITARRPPLIIEIHPGTLAAAGQSTTKLLERLQQLGYRYYAEMNQPKVYLPIDGLEMQTQRNIILRMDANR